MVIVTLSGCNSTEKTTSPTPEELIIGQWYNDSQSMILNYTFYDNHTTCLSLGIKSFWTGYEITEDHIIITNLTDGSSTSYKYVFTDNNQKLRITDPDGYVVDLKRR